MNTVNHESSVNGAVAVETPVASPEISAALQARIELELPWLQKYFRNSYVLIGLNGVLMIGPEIADLETLASARRQRKMGECAIRKVSE